MIRMNINQPAQVSQENFDIKGKNEKPVVVGKNEELKEEVPFAKKMFEYIEAEVDTEVEKGPFQTKVGLSRENKTPVGLQDKLSQERFDFIKVVGLSERKLLLRSEKTEGWEDSALDPLLKWLSKVKPFEENDLYISRLVWLECKGLPMNAWIESNLKAFTKSFGEWISWTYQRDNMNVLFNPLICLSSNSPSLINEELKILIKGKQCHICFSEIVEGEVLKGLMLPMEESNISSTSYSKAQESTKEENSILKGKVLEVGIKDGKIEDHALEVSPSRTDSERVSESEEEIGFSNPQKGSSPTEKPEHFRLTRKENVSISSVSVTKLSNQQEEHSSSGVIIALSSHVSLCNNLGGLKMGGFRGRPRKKPRASKNPFNLGISRIKLSRKFKVSGKEFLKSYGKSLDKELLNPISEELGEDLNKEASNIVQCAQDLGLELFGDKEGVVKVVARQLQEGSL